MASPNDKLSTSGDIGTVALHCVFAVGASGAPGTITRQKEFLAGTAAVSHTSTGLYRLTLREGWVALLNHNIKCDQATYSTSGACFTDLKAFSITAGTFDVEFRTLAGALVDPASGDTVRVTLELQKTQP